MCKGNEEQWVTSHSGVCVKGSVYDGDEADYYETLVDVVKLHYGCNSVALFKCECYNNTSSVCVIQSHDIVEVNYKTRLRSPNVYMLAQQSQQVDFMSYPSKWHGQEDWMVACKVRHRCSFNVREFLDTTLIYIMLKRVHWHVQGLRLILIGP